MLRIYTLSFSICLEDCFIYLLIQHILDPRDLSLKKTDKAYILASETDDL